MQKLIMKLAWTNLKKNKEIYIPYIISGLLACAFYYIFVALAMNPGVGKLYGGKTIKETLKLGSRIIALASGVIVLYANSFTMKRRMVEMGLYSVLGLEKRHVRRMVIIETVLVEIGVLAAGTGMGMLLDKLSYALMLRVMRFPITLNSFFSPKMVIETAIVFGIIFLAVILVNCWKITRYNPLALMKEKRSGEKEIRFLWVGTLLGILLLAAAYAIALSVEDPLEALVKFFGAVLLAAGGTFFVFQSGSIMLFRILQKNKRYYYKPQNFIAVSNLIFRIRKNASGMASICILCSMALVSMIGGISLYKGGRDYLKMMCPTSYGVAITRDAGKEQEDVRHIGEVWKADDEILASAQKEQGLEPVGAENYRYLLIFLGDKAAPYKVETEKRKGGAKIPKSCLTIIDKAAYKEMTGKTIDLKPTEVALYDTRLPKGEKQVQLGNKEYKVKKLLKNDFTQGHLMRTMSNLLNDEKTMVVSDLETFLEGQPEILQGSNVSRIHFYSWKENSRPRESFRAEMRTTLYSDPLLANEKMMTVFDRHYDELEYYQLLGGVIFVGGFLAILFLTAMILVIYYKQYAEGHEDRERFDILKKVGLDVKDINKTIARQVMTVFFLPITLAIIHMAFAYKLIQQILQLIGMVNKQKMLTISIGTSVAMVLFYGLTYLVTAKVYKNIVTKK